LFFCRSKEKERQEKPQDREKEKKVEKVKQHKTSKHVSKEGGGGGGEGTEVRRKELVVVAAAAAGQTPAKTSEPRQQQPIGENGLPKQKGTEVQQHQQQQQRTKQPDSQPVAARAHSVPQPFR
jgi:hypothetical protein